MSILSDIELNQFQAEAFARGLYAIASADGVHDSEKAMVAAFWADTFGSEKAFSELERREAITAEELTAQLGSVEERRTFLKTALLLAFADGKVSDKERALIDTYAAAMGLSGELETLAEAVGDHLLSHLSKLQNVESVAQVARKLSRF